MLPSGLPEHVHDDEELVRFLTSSSQFNSTMVKPSAFMPKNGTTSVFRHESEPNNHIWLLGKDHIETTRTVYGAAIIRALHVRMAFLDVVAHEPPPRHANILGWPSTTDPEMQRAKQKEFATALAQNAKLIKA